MIELRDTNLLRNAGKCFSHIVPTRAVSGYWSRAVYKLNGVHCYCWFILLFSSDNAKHKIQSTSTAFAGWRTWRFSSTLGGQHHIVGLNNQIKSIFHHPTKKYCTSICCKTMVMLYSLCTLRQQYTTWSSSEPGTEDFLKLYIFRQPNTTWSQPHLPQAGLLLSQPPWKQRL